MDSYSTFKDRFIAFAIDIFFVFFFAFFAQYFFSDKLGDAESLLSLVIYAIYFICSHVIYGQTLGKLYMNIKVVSINDGRLLSFKEALVRQSVWILIDFLGILYSFYQQHQLSPSQDKVVSNFDTYTNYLGIIWFILELVTMQMNRKKRALHDYMAGSVVIKI